MPGLTTETDDATGHPLLRKRVYDSLFFTIYLDGKIAAGSSIATVVGVTSTKRDDVDNSTNVIISDTSHDATGVKFLCGGGTDGESYTITARATTNGGESAEGVAIVKVSD